MSRPAGGPNFPRLAIFAFLSFGISGPTAAQEIDPSAYQQLEFRHIGPVGNRVASVAGV